MLMLAMCLAMSPAYSFMMVQDPLAIVTTVNNFVQTLTYYKNQIQKTYDEYRRIAKAAKAISSGDWKEALRGVADLANQINEWDLFGSEVDLLLESLASGNNGAVDAYDNAMKVNDAWNKLAKTFKNISNAGNIKNMDDLFERTLSGISAIEDVGKAGAKTINEALYAVTDTLNPVIEVFNAQEMREKIAKKEGLIKTREHLKEVIEKQKELVKKKSEEELTKLKEDLNSAATNQESTKVEQLSKEIGYKYQEIAKIERLITANKETLEKVNEEINTLTNEITEQQTSPGTYTWFEKQAKMVQEALEKTKISELRNKMREVAYVSDYGRN